MPYTFAELESLRKKLDRERIELEERERALSKVEQMLREEMESRSERMPQLPIIAPIPGATGFADAVRIAVAAQGNSEFAVHDIEHYLLTHGYELPKLDPRSRIAMVFQQMRARKNIILISQGKGRSPSTYRVKK
jgi:hypothetical protein